MNLSEVIQARQSVRAFQARELEADKLQAILAAANQAPSAGNLQAYQVYLVKDVKLKRALAKAALDQEFVARAPVVLVFCVVPARNTQYGKRGEDLYAVQDAAVATAYAQLAATDLGLATCWVGAYRDDDVRSALNLPAGHRPVALLPIGYAAEQPPRSPRRPLEDLVTPCPISVTERKAPAPPRS